MGTARAETYKMHVLIIDDHPLLIRGMQTLLTEIEPTITTSSAMSVEDGVLKCKDESPDLIMLDLNLPGMRDVDALVHVRAAVSVPIVVVSANDQPRCIWQAIELGAAGYIPKDTDPTLTTHALRVVLARGVYVPPHAITNSPSLPSFSSQPAPTLSHRQLSVLRRLLQGKSNKVIARELAVAEGTVKAHLWSIYQALGVNTRLQAMARAHEQHLVDKFGLVD